MTEHKFTDEEVIKALECCAHADCMNCPRWSEEWTSGMCADFLPTVLDLINRQRAEIEVLKGVIAAYEDAARKRHEEHVKQQAMIDEILTILRGGQPNDPPSMQAGLSSEIE